MSLTKLIRQYLADEYLQPRSSEPEAPKTQGTSLPPVQASPPSTQTLTKISSEGRPGVPEDPELLALYLDCLNNLRYPLAETATNLVFGSGSRTASVMIIGEAPGADEDAQGLPFVGRSGSYMMEVFERFGLVRDQVYIANILKHRPPNNRAPSPDEIEACTPYLVKQIALIRPKLLVTAGNFACKFILQTETGITKMRGTLHESPYGTVFPVLHPSAIIRGAYPKDMFEGDIARIVEILSGL